jgi:hypothetical protein
VHRLDPLASGGVEPTEERESTPVPAGIPAGHGKIMRDEAGNVVGIEIVEAESEMKDGMSRWTEVGGPKSNAGEFGSNMVKFSLNSERKKRDPVFYYLMVLA